MSIATIDDVRRLEATAERFETPCGDGSMVWRRFGAGHDREPLILLHGGSGSWTHWVRTIPDLAQDHELWVADMPGLGDSAMPAKPPVPENSADAVVHGIRTLVPAERRPRLVCFSFGAHVGTFAAGRLGAHIRAMTIIGTSALGIRRPTMVFPKEHSAMTHAEALGVHRKVLELLMLSRPDRVDDLAVALQADNVRKARFRSRPFAATDNVRQGLAHVSVPLTTIWGRKDVVGYPTVEACLDILREHHPELVAEIIPDAGHWVMYEQPQVFNAALRRMLALH